MASVPEFTKRTRSRPVAAQILWPSSTSLGESAPKAVPPLGGLGERRDDRGVGVAQDQGAVRGDIVEVFPSVCVVHPCPGRADDGYGLPADRPERTHGAGNAPGEERSRLLA